MDLDHRFRPSTGTGGRIILLGDGTEIETDGADNDMFDNDNEDKDLESQVDKFSKDDSNKREGTPGPNTTEVTESPSSVATEKSDTTDKDTKGEKSKLETSAQTSEK
jgi:protein phosphatase 2C family protein 2/3